MRRARLVIHAGTHKTGTTFIQNSLAAASPRLRRHGIFYPVMGPAGGQHGLTTLWAPRMRAYASPAEAEVGWQAVAEGARDHHTVLVSSEEFSSAHPDRLDLEAIRARTRFDEIVVVCFLRNQVELLQSIYCEASRRQPPPPPPEFMARAMASGIAWDVAADFAILEREVFAGAAGICYVDYDRAARAPGGVIAALLAAAGLDPRLVDEIAPAEEAAANRSANPLAVWAANMVSGERVATRPLLARCQRLVAHHAPGPASLWERAERQRIVEHFAPLNAAFEARVRVRQPDFALTPHALEAERVSRGALDVRFWNHLARDIYNGRLPEAA